MEQPALIVVTPIFEDVEAAGQLCCELARLNPVPFVVAVDDGSVSQPVSAALLEQAGLQGIVLRLKRNVGHQRAIAIGLNYVAEHYPMAQVVVMDSDGEDKPSTIAELLRVLDNDNTDVVVAQRKSRVETFKFKAFYVVYKVIFQLLTGKRISFGNFMALKPAAVKRLAAMQELWIHVAGSVLVSRLRLATCPLDRGARYAGQSKMNFVGLALHGFKGLMVFAEDVLVRVGIACAVVATGSVVGSCAAIVLKVIGFATPGWFSVALGILLLVFLQTGVLALMSLLLTGVVRGGGISRDDYTTFIDEISYATAP
jgi:hypothetical protein